LHIVGGKNYTCYTTISELFVNYAKVAIIIGRKLISRQETQSLNK